MLTFPVRSHGYFAHRLKMEASGMMMVMVLRERERKREAAWWEV